MDQKAINMLVTSIAQLGADMLVQMSTLQRQLSEATEELKNLSKPKED